MGRSAWRRTAAIGTAVGDGSGTFRVSAGPRREQRIGRRVDRASSTTRRTDDDGDVTILGAFGGTRRRTSRRPRSGVRGGVRDRHQVHRGPDFTTTIKTRVGVRRQPRHRPLPAARRHLLELAADGNDPADRHLPRLRHARRHAGPGLPRRRPGSTAASTAPRCGWRSRASSGTRRRPGTAGRLPRELATLQELIDFAAADQPTRASTPWCMAWESDQATGWVGTDWIEQYDARRSTAQTSTTTGPSHEIPFDDPQIVEGLRRVRQDRQDRRRGARRHEGHPQHPVRRGRWSPPFANAGRAAAGAAGQLRDRRSSPRRSRHDLDNEVGVFTFPRYERRLRRRRRSLVVATSPRCSTATTRTPSKVMEFLTSDQFGAEWAAGRRLAVAAHAPSTRATTPTRRTKDIAEHGLPGLGRSALRRLGPDAEGGRLGHLLDRDGRVDRRQEHRRRPRPTSRPAGLPRSERMTP